MSKLFLDFHTDFSYISLFVVTNFVFLFICLAYIIYSFKKEVSLFSRFSFVLSTLAHFIFQWPLALYSYIFETTMQSYWFFAFSIHACIIAGFVWPHLTKSLTLNLSRENPPAHSQPLPNNIFILTYALTFLFLAAYLFFIPFSCTGLWAFLFDPQFTLLAREVSGKLSASKIPSYSYGILVNVLCPLLAYLAVYKVFFEERKIKIVSVVLLIVSVPIIFCILFLTAAKGNLIPSAIALLIGFFVRSGRFTLFSFCKIVIPVAAVAMILIVGVDVLKERSSQSLIPYNLGYCAQKMGACEQSQILLDSLHGRHQSLGFDNTQIVILEDQLKEYCFVKKEEPQAKSLSPNKSRPSLVSVERPARTKLTPKTQVPKVLPPQPVVNDEPNSEMESKIDLILRYAHSIYYRAAVVPTQIGSWHFKYVEEYGSPGIYALPFAAKIFGKSFCVPTQINQVYGAIYSSGAKVSTGTAPTTFLLAYPAYWGLWGLLGALISVLIFDLIASLILLRLSEVIRPIAVGLLWVIAYNCLASDLLAALLSHGAFIALVILFFFTLIDKNSKKGSV